MRLIGLLFLSGFLFISCTKEKVTPLALPRPGCDTFSLGYKWSYSGDIAPIISANCSGTTCHNAGAGNYDFSIYEVLADRIRNGSMRYRLLLPTNDNQHMPLTGPPQYKPLTLDSCSLYKILTWIDQGFPNN